MAFDSAWRCPYDCAAMAQVHPQDTVDVTQAARLGSVYDCEFNLAGVVAVIDAPSSSEPAIAVDQDVSEQDLPLSRLAAAVERLFAVTARFEFGRDDYGRCVVRGTAEARVALPCQRCLNAVEQVVTTELASIVWLGTQPPDELQNTEQDVVLTQSSQMTFSALVEDDLLLALPQQVCQNEDCPDAPAELRGVPDEALPGAEGKSDAGSTLAGDRQRPFADLKDMLESQAAGNNTNDNTDE